MRIEGLSVLRRTLPFPVLRGLFVTPEGGEDELDVLRDGGFSRVMTPYSTGVIDLTRAEPDLRAAMHQKWRNRLVAAEQAGLRIGRADRRPELYQWLLEQEARQQKLHRYAALPVALVPAWQEAGGGLRVLTARQGDETVAAMLFLIHGRRATYHIGWSSTEGKRLNAHNLILWHAIRKLKALGLAELDLGGLNTEDVPGIARFKLGAGAKLKTLCGTWFGR
jgi:lipid II:glycine glycyltransferase (peptidoglycan interpeptide bridge formation enzyme)